MHLYEAAGAADAVELWVLYGCFAICSWNWKVGVVDKASHASAAVTAMTGQRARLIK